METWKVIYVEIHVVSTARLFAESLIVITSVGSCSCFLLTLINKHEKDNDRRGDTFNVLKTTFQYLKKSNFKIGQLKVGWKVLISRGSYGNSFSDVFRNSCRYFLF